MAYSELIKNFEKIRNYMNDFYVYGFKSREEFDKKSRRSYDNERRRIESYIGKYMSFSQGEGGKNIFISVDTKRTENNPLYKALKAKSFTNKDITIHFILLDLLHDSSVQMTLKEITEKMDTEYLYHFQHPMAFDESTIRKKLKEYVEIGIISRVKEGQVVLYSRKKDFDLSGWKDAIAFFSEAGQLGVIGSFLMDKYEYQNLYFTFKHHYITYALESEVLYKLFCAIREKRCVVITKFGARSGIVVPLKIFVSAQSGREYLLGLDKKLNNINAYRLDFITSVQLTEVYQEFPLLREKLTQMQKHMWGIQCAKNNKALERVSFTVHIGDYEEHIVQRLEREKRCGQVIRVDKNTCVFTAEVYDTNEMIPWIRTFLCRITQMNFSNRTVENSFKKDLETMYHMYDIEEE